MGYERAPVTVRYCVTAGSATSRKKTLVVVGFKVISRSIPAGKRG